MSPDENILAGRPTPYSSFMNKGDLDVMAGNATRWGGLLREPLVQFLLLGAALFAASQAISVWRAGAEKRIVIDAALVQYQRNLYHAQYGAWPDASTLESLVRAHVRDEALYREALRLGLDQGDEVIRQRLIQKMEVVLTDAAPPPDPDDATLQRFLDAHAAQYSAPDRVSFELLYFADDAGDPKRGEQRAREALRRLATGATDVDSDDFALGSHFESTDADELARRFGDSPMAHAPFEAPKNQWSGPVRSGFGWHLLRVTALAASRPATLAALRERLRADWLADYREKDRQRRIDQLVAGHEIIRRDAVPAPAPAQ